MTPDIECSHPALVKAAAAWLNKTCSVVITEMSTSGEDPDAIGWQGSMSTLVECKISKSDFHADKKKWFRREPQFGIGVRRYFLTVAGLVTPDEIPDRWGLLALADRRITVVRKSERFVDVNSRHEVGLLLSTLRRIGRGGTFSGASIKCYSHTTKNKATLSVDSSPI